MWLIAKYKSNEVNKVINKIIQENKNDISTEKIIKESLKKL